MKYTDRRLQLERAVYDHPATHLLASAGLLGVVGWLLVKVRRLRNA
jgi:hypothetical protein